MDFFGRQDWARRRTRWLVTLFVLAVIALVLAVNVGCYFAATLGAPLLLDNGKPMQLSLLEWFTGAPALWVSLATLLVIGLGSGINWLQISGGGKAVAAMVSARRISASTTDDDERRLLNVVEEMAIASGTPVPAVFVMDNEAGINAFVAGLSSEDTVLVVTKGTLQTLNRQELQGVIAHEYSHILHGDMRLNVRLIGVLAGILLIGQLGEFILRHMRHSGRSRDKEGGAAVVAIAVLGLSLMVIGYLGLFFGRLIKAGVSRQREFLADASAVQFTRDNTGIAGALAKIQTHSGQSLLMNAHAEDMSHMCFGESIRVHMAGLLSTHPPVPERIQALGFSPEVMIRQMQRQQLQQKTQQAEAQQKAKAAARVVPDVLSTAVVMASIGTVQPEQLEQAEQLIDSISPELHDMAHSAADVALLVLALMLHGQAERDGGSAMANVLSTVRQQQLPKLAQHINRLNATSRWTLLNLSKLALQELDTLQRQQLLLALLAIARQDRLITIQEFTLYTLVRQWLQPKQHKGPTLNRFSVAQQALITVLGAVIFCANDDMNTEQKRQQLQRALTSFGMADSGQLPERFDAVAFDESLDVLDRLSPLLKKTLINTLAELLIADQQVTAEEQALFRAVCERLNCAMPLLSG